MATPIINFIENIQKSKRHNLNFVLYASSVQMLFHESYLKKYASIFFFFDIRIDVLDFKLI